MANSLFENYITNSAVTDKKLKKLIIGDRIIDLLFHFPYKFIERKIVDSLKDVKAGDYATVLIKIEEHNNPFNRRAPYRVFARNKNNEVIFIDFFRYNIPYLKKILPVGQEKIISGKINIYQDIKQFSHPDLILDVHKFKNYNESIYSLVQGVAQKDIQNIIKNHLKYIDFFDQIEEWQDKEFVKKNNFLSFKETITKLHNPSDINDLDVGSSLVKRIAYDEFLAMQVALLLIRNKNDIKIGLKIFNQESLIKKFLALLPFQLTEGQKKSFLEIKSQLNSKKSMNSLLQGDVGSGKTVVAALSVLYVIESGYQASFMVPTAVLAKQQYQFLELYFKELGLKIALITGEIKGKKRKVLEEQIAKGEIDLVVGTHALLYDNINFSNLALTIIDEQHKFGVEQRIKLIEKGKDVQNYLLMSATPIPRSLALSLYGDLSVITMIDKPKKRQEIDTRIISSERVYEVINSLSRVIDKEKIYWICPLVEESQKLNFSAVEQRFGEFSRVFGKDKVGLVHGKMKDKDKNQALDDFKQGKYRILIATTVIEVGVDVKDATIMVIEHSNRFGLAQLHQLRGRVGRGELAGKCILIYDKNDELEQNLSQNSYDRLKIMKETNDGFRIAEQDLKIRGGGEILGTKQSGLPEWKIANLKDHLDLLKISYQDAQLILNKDPNLDSTRGMAIKILLKIFNYDKKLQLIN